MLVELKSLWTHQTLTTFSNLDPYLPIHNVKGWRGRPHFQKSLLLPVRSRSENQAQHVRPALAAYSPSVAGCFCSRHSSTPPSWGWFDWLSSHSVTLALSRSKRHLDWPVSCRSSSRSTMNGKKSCSADHDEAEGIGIIAVVKLRTGVAVFGCRPFGIDMLQMLATKNYRP